MPMAEKVNTQNKKNPKSLKAHEIKGKAKKSQKKPAFP